MALRCSVSTVASRPTRSLLYGRPMRRASRTPTVRYWATLCLYLDEAGATEALAAMKAQDEDEGFVWVGDLVTVLDEARKKKGGTFRYADTLPAVALTFDRFAGDDAAVASVTRFRGSINAVYQRKPTVLVPQAGNGPTVRLGESVRAQQAKFGNPVVSTATQTTLTTGQSWVVYGSPSTNPHTKTLLDAMGFVVKRDRIRVGERQWDGEDLVLIAAHPRPGDDAQAVLLYAAFDDATLLGINTVFHGPTDWVVAQRTLTGFDVLDRGNFSRGPDGKVLPLSAGR